MDQLIFLEIYVTELREYEPMNSLSLRQLASCCWRALSAWDVASEETWCEEQPSVRRSLWCQNTASGRLSSENRNTRVENRHLEGTKLSKYDRDTLHRIEVLRWWQIKIGKKQQVRFVFTKRWQIRQCQNFHLEPEENRPVMKGCIWDYRASTRSGTPTVAEHHYFPEDFVWDHAVV